MTHSQADDPHVLASAAVVVGVNGSEASARALRWAAHFAARRGRSLLIVHGLDLAAADTILGSYEVIEPSVIEAAGAQGRQDLAAAESMAWEAEPGLRVSTSMTSDTGARLLVEHSATAALTVLGATGSIGTLGHLGSTLLAVTSHARGPVVVVRGDPRGDMAVRDSGPVVVGVDGSPVSDAAIGVAFAEASERRTDLIAVHTWSDWSASRFAGAGVPDDSAAIESVEEVILAERLAGWQEKYPDVAVSRRLTAAGPAEELLRLSTSAQLVVIGNRGRGGFTGLLLGSTTHALVQHAGCPVLVVRADDTDRPRR